MLKIRTLADRFFRRADDLPISYVLDGKPLSGIPGTWHTVLDARWIDANIRETVFEGADPATGLHVRVEYTEYRDFPVVEWVAWFTNHGQTPTPIIHDILAMDGRFQGTSPVLHHCNGDFNSAEGYTPQETPLKPGETLAFAPNGGRPCDGAFPYHRIVFADGGLTLATGWPAQWAARFEALANGVHVRIGQEKTNLRLMPGERIRTPRMTIMAWSGDATRSVNLWRRWYLTHILPRPDGRSMRPLLACAATDEGEEFTAATGENQVRYIGEFHRHGISLTSGGSTLAGTPAATKSRRESGGSPVHGSQTRRDSRAA
jgi:alpha-galactosidase